MLETPFQKIILNYSLSKIRKRISWQFFLYAWRTKKNTLQADSLIADVQDLLDIIITQKKLTANAIYALYPARSVGESVHLYKNIEDSTPLRELHFLRQQEIDTDFLCLADFVSPDKKKVKKEAMPILGCFIASAGIGSTELEKEFDKENDPYKKLLTSTLAQRLTEAFSEELESLVHSHYPDTNIIRPAVGYSSLADHSDKKILFELLQPEEKIGVVLTENFAMLPEQSVAGYYFMGDNARYFNIRSVGDDQLKVYAEKKGIDISVLKQWINFIP